MIVYQVMSHTLGVTSTLSFPPYRVLNESKNPYGYEHLIDDYDVHRYDL